MAEKKRGRDYWLTLLREHARSGETLAAFCKRRRVSYKTARNWRSRFGDDEIGGNGGTVPVPDESGQGHQGFSGEGDSGSGADEPGDGEKSEPRTPPLEGDTLPGGGKHAGGSDKPARKPHPGWANLIPAEPGNQRARKHGGYSKYLPPEVQDEVNTYGRNDLLSVIEEIRLTKGRLIMVTRSRAAWDAKVDYAELTDTDYQVDEIAEKKTPDGRERSVKRTRPKFEDLEDQLTRRLAWLQQVHDTLSRRVSYTADEAARLRSDIMTRADDEGWTAIETGWEIEKLGLELPFTLQQRIRSELALMEPEEPEGGMTDDELEALSVEYERKMSGEPQWLAERRSEVKEIHEAKDAERKGE